MDRENDIQSNIFNLQDDSDMLSQAERLAAEEEERLQADMDRFFSLTPQANLPEVDVEDEEEESINIIPDKDGGFSVVSDAVERQEEATPAPQKSIFDKIVLEHVIKKRLSAYKSTRTKLYQLDDELNYIDEDFSIETNKKINSYINQLESLFFAKDIELDSLDKVLRDKIEKETKAFMQKTLELVDEMME